MEILKFKIFGFGVMAGVIAENVLKEGHEFEGKFQFMNQVHGDKIVEVFKIGKDVECDGLVTKNFVPLAVKTADCIPLVMADEDSNIFAAVHAGWRGLTKDIIPKAVDKMLEMGAKAECIKVGIGPSLGFSCAEFSDPYNEIPEKYHYAIFGRNVDLIKIALDQLHIKGITQIEHIDICTKCDPKYFSFRRDGTKKDLPL